MIESPPYRPLPQRMAKLILLGFALLIGLMSVLVVNSVLGMRSQAERIRDIVELRNLKIELVTDLLKATYGRHNSLVYQTIVSDPFIQDEHFQQYIKWGYEVGKARNALRTLPLDAFERQKLDQQDRLIASIVDLHDRISDLARQGRGDAARELIAGRLRPFNIEFLASVDQLEHYERDQTQRALEDARRTSRNAITLSVALGAALLLLACAIAYLTYRQMGRHADTINAQIQVLEDTGQQLRHEATHDPLTGLPNRSLFYHRLVEAMAHASQDGLKAAILYVDLDDFKPVNDRYGHAVGDSLLQVVAGRLLGSVRANDTVARLGGDEFAIILLGVGEMAHIDHIKDEIRHHMMQPVRLGDVELRPAFSCGHAVFPDDGASMDALLHAADSRMYAVKRCRVRPPS